MIPTWVLWFQLVEVSSGASCNLTLRPDLAAITLKTANPLKMAQFLQASRVLQFREDWKMAECQPAKPFLWCANQP
jgi:hypothetical protein